MSEELEFVKPQPPREMYENTFITAVEGVQEEYATLPVIDRIEIGNGIQVFYRDAEFPKKGWPTDEAVSCINIAKRSLLFILTPALVFSSKSLLKRWAKFSAKVIAPHRRKVEYMTPISREIRAIGMGDISEVISWIIEYDDAYRFRLQDICSETDKETLMKRPFREIRRLAQIVYDREQNLRLKADIIRLKKVATLALLLPPVRKLLRNILKNMDFKNMQYDEADKYWVALRGGATVGIDGYFFRGMSHEDRAKTVKSRPFHVQLQK